LLFSLQRAGSISFGEFSAVLEQCDPVQHAAPGGTDIAGVDTGADSFTETPLHSAIAGWYCSSILSFYAPESVVLLQCLNTYTLV